MPKNFSRISLDHFWNHRDLVQSAHIALEGDNTGKSGNAKIDLVGRKTQSDGIGNGGEVIGSELHVLAQRSHELANAIRTTANSVLDHIAREWNRGGVANQTIRHEGMDDCFQILEGPKTTENGARRRFAVMVGAFDMIEDDNLFNELFSSSWNDTHNTVVGVANPNAFRLFPFVSLVIIPMVAMDVLVGAG